MKKLGCAALTVVLGCIFLSLPAVGQVAIGQVAVGQAVTERVPADSLAEPTASSFGSGLSCVQPQKLEVPRSVAKRARIKAQLMNVLRESIFDDAKGVVNLARERQIKELINRLKAE